MEGRSGVAQNVDPVLSKLNQTKEGGPARSKLAAWMVENQEGFAAVVDARTKTWHAMAAVFIECGLLEKPDGYDNEGEAGDLARARVATLARQTWHRVQKRKTGPRGRKRAGSTKPKAPPAAAPAEQTWGENPAMRVLRRDETPDEAAERRRLAAISDQQGRSR
jgi:hypothetical protein